MNKGCYYTAQGQFACQIETPVKKESFRIIETFYGNSGPTVSVDPLKLLEPEPNSEFKSFKSSCRISKLTSKDGKVMDKCTVSGCVSTAKPPYCILNCPACAIDDSQHVNDIGKPVVTNDYCAKTQDGGSGSRCKASTLQFTIRAEKINNKDVYMGNETIVNYRGKLYTLEEAKKAKQMFAQSTQQTNQSVPGEMS